MSEPAKQQQKQQVQIKADEKELLGQYSNLAVIHHNGEEFTLNFIYLISERAAGQAGCQRDFKPRCTRSGCCRR